jgi:hypothetical protein
MYVIRDHYEDEAILAAHSWAQEHVDFIEAVFEPFLETGRWAKPADLHRQLHRLGRGIDVYGLAEDLPAQLGTPWRGPDGDLFLRIRALQFCDRAGPLLEGAIHLLQVAYRRFLSEDPQPRIDAADLTSTTLQRAALILQREQLSMIHGSHDTWVPQWTGLINLNLIDKVQHVQTVSDYLRCEASFFRERALPSSVFARQPETESHPPLPASHEEAPPVGRAAQGANAISIDRGGMTLQEITRTVNRYIGVTGGYLGDFSYRTHAEFYPEYCDLDVDPYQFEGTTRERFIAILSGLAPHKQARVLRGVMERFPLGDGPDTRNEAARSELLRIAQRLEGSPSVPGVPLQITSEVVTRALDDADALIAKSGFVSAIDRVHTALHGYLIAASESAGIAVVPDAPITVVFKELRKSHPNLTTAGPRALEVDKVLNSCANILDALGPLRNRASVAHPNAALLGEDEARLVFNLVRALLTFLDAKLA